MQTGNQLGSDFTPAHTDRACKASGNTSAQLSDYGLSLDRTMGVPIWNPGEYTLANWIALLKLDSRLGQARTEVSPKGSRRFCYFLTASGPVKANNDSGPAFVHATVRGFIFKQSLYSQSQKRFVESSAWKATSSSSSRPH